MKQWEMSIQKTKHNTGVNYIYLLQFGHVMWEKFIRTQAKVITK